MFQSFLQFSDFLLLQLQQIWYVLFENLIKWQGVTRKSYCSQTTWTVWFAIRFELSSS